MITTHDASMLSIGLKADLHQHHIKLQGVITSQLLKSTMSRLQRCRHVLSALAQGEAVEVVEVAMKAVELTPPARVRVVVVKVAVMAALITSPESKLGGERRTHQIWRWEHEKSMVLASTNMPLTVVI